MLSMINRMPRRQRLPTNGQWRQTSALHVLYMDVRSLATGKLLATWSLGILKPAESR